MANLAHVNAGIACPEAADRPEAAPNCRGGSIVLAAWWGCGWCVPSSAAPAGLFQVKKKGEGGWEEIYREKQGECSDGDLCQQVLSSRPVLALVKL